MQMVHYPLARSMRSQFIIKIMLKEIIRYMIEDMIVHQRSQNRAWRMPCIKAVPPEAHIIAKDRHAVKTNVVKGSQMRKILRLASRDSRATHSTIMMRLDPSSTRD